MTCRGIPKYVTLPNRGAETRPSTCPAAPYAGGPETYKCEPGGWHSLAGGRTVREVDRDVSLRRSECQCGITWTITVEMTARDERL